VRQTREATLPQHKQCCDEPTPGQLARTRCLWMDGCKVTVINVHLHAIPLLTENNAAELAHPAAILPGKQRPINHMHAQATAADRHSVGSESLRTVHNASRCVRQHMRGVNWTNEAQDCTDVSTESGTAQRSCAHYVGRQKWSTRGTLSQATKPPQATPQQPQTPRRGDHRGCNRHRPTPTTQPSSDTTSTHCGAGGTGG
jgi:hypothetical protein